MTARSVQNPLLVALSTALVGCATVTEEPDIRLASNVDINRFMGDWYVISSIPTFIEKEAFNAVETYALDEDGNIATTFSFNKGGYDGKRKSYNPKGFVKPGTGNAIWGMRFVWPIKADYRIVYVNDDYSQTIIGRNKRDYAWIMSRNPELSTDSYFELVKVLREEGYDTNKLRVVPQRWDGE